jgi:hypothetical protein
MLSKCLLITGVMVEGCMQCQNTIFTSLFKIISCQDLNSETMTRKIKKAKISLIGLRKV